MDTIVYDDLALERIAKEQFGMSVDVGKVIARSIPVSRSAQATVFLTKKKQLFAYIDAQSPTTLADIKKLVTRMGLRAELYLPPKGQAHYFDDIGTARFKEVFPGRSHVSEMDILFYRTLAPYNPALVLISEVKNGEIYQFDSDTHGEWRMAARFAYRRIRTS